MPVYPPPASGGGGSSVTFHDEGSAVGTGTVLNFVGAGVTATFSGGTAIATIAGGGVSLVSITQSTQATGSPPGSLAWSSAPASGSLLVLIGANNGPDYTSLTQTNVTWTSRRADNVAGVGNLFIWTGAVSGAGGTATTLTGGGGGGSVLAVEIPSMTYSSLGANGIYATQAGTGNKATNALRGVPSGRLVCCIIHGAAGNVGSPPIMSCPAVWSTIDTVNGLAFGLATGHDIAAWHAAGAKYYTLVDIVPA